CALWASTDYDGEPLDLRELAPEAEVQLIEDANEFWAAHWQEIRDNPSQAGHDFWLTRNGHGAGFWDGDWPKVLGRKLTESAHAWGECNLHVGDDGLVYVL